MDDITFFRCGCEGSLKPVVALKFDDASRTLLVDLSGALIGDYSPIGDSCGLLLVLLHQVH